MAESNRDQSAETVSSSPLSPDEIKDLDPKVSDAEQSSVVGGAGRKAGKEQQEYYIVKMEDAFITSV